jgi:hypothetical protein
MSLLQLPYEIRQVIFQYALRQKGTIELQHPFWAHPSPFPQPLFQLCRLLCDEALRAFYESNTFLWVIDLDTPHRSDPCTYAGMGGTADRWPDSVNALATGLTPGVPWAYPHLRKHLRHLNLNIYLPTNKALTSEVDRLWFIEFAQCLRKLVVALDHGRTLTDLQLLFTANRNFDAWTALTSAQLKVISEALSLMEVKGNVAVLTRFDLRGAKSSIAGLCLEQHMRA